jgi:hypothetical protein
MGLRPTQGDEERWWPAIFARRAPTANLACSSTERHSRPRFRLQPAFSAPQTILPFTTVATGPPRNAFPSNGEFLLFENDLFTS